MSIADRARQALLLTVVALPSLGAQGRIDGILFDSTRSGAPLANAEVVLLDAGRRATTDARGRFSFTNVPVGSQRVAYAALWLDSVGAPPALQRVEVPARGRVRTVLATTPHTALQRAECGTTFANDVGLLVGQVLDAERSDPAEGVVVEAQWSERHLGRAMNAVHTVATVDTTDASGRYALCGVPVDVRVSLSAAHPDGRGVDTLQLTMPSRVGASVLRVGRGERTTVVTGRVTGPTGQPMARANLVSSLGADRPLVTDSTGRFRFAVPARSGQLYVRTLGYQPTFVEFSPSDEEVELGDVVLQPVGAVLDTRIITARPRTREEAEFYRRKAIGLGAFLDSADMAMWPRISADMIAVSTRSWVRADNVQSQGMRQLPFSTIQLRSNGKICRPAAWVDGYRWGTIDPVDEHNILQHAKRIEIYIEAFAPPEFVDAGNNCGALVIWTR